MRPYNFNRGQPEHLGIKPRAKTPRRSAKTSIDARNPV
jgi:hypothetical protein